MERYHDEHGREVLEPMAAAFEGANISCRTHTVVGDPVKRMVDHAREAGGRPDRLVTHARETIPEVLFGSVTAGVWSGSRCRWR